MKETKDQWGEVGKEPDQAENGQMAPWHEPMMCGVVCGVYLAS